MARALRIGRKPNKPYIYNISTKKRFCQENRYKTILIIEVFDDPKYSDSKSRPVASKALACYGVKH